MAASIRLLKHCFMVKTGRHLKNLPIVHLHITSTMKRASEHDFNLAKERLKTLKKDPGNEMKLQIYALFKQATQGPCNAPKPGMLDFVNKAKWDAWNSLGGLPQEQARQKYVDLVSSLMLAEAPNQTADSAVDGTSKYMRIQLTTENNITTIRLNRPNKKNAITVEMYKEIMQALKQAAEEDSVLTVLTGNGDYYCSGNDLNNFMNVSPDNIKKMAKDSGELLRDFVNSFIDFPKPLISLVNGPAVGVSVTLLGLFDIVYATDRATFHTPFSQLGQSPEGCSSYIFPKIMGSAKANEVLLFNKKLTAHEACNLGLVTEVFPDSTFQKETWARIKAYATLPKNSLAYSKQLIREVEKEKLHKVNAQECERLVERWTSDECFNAIMSFFQNKAKL